MDLKAHLKALTERHAPSGHEGPVRAYLREAWADLVDEFQVDGLGSLIGIKHGRRDAPRPRIMLSAHMDEIAMIVAEVRDGYARVERLSGVDNRIMQAKPVIVHGKQALPGVFAAVPPHISNVTGDGRTNYLGFDSQWIDFGLGADEVAEAVSVGDFVTMDAPMVELKGGLLVGKAMDDRASVAAVTYCLHLLQKRLHEWDVYAVASTQEEKGLLGATTAAHKIAPALAIAIDVTFAKQPGVNGDNDPTVGKGPLISLGPNFHPGLYERLRETARECDLPLHLDPLSGRSGTDAWAIQVSRAGVPTALLNIPVKNMHSPVETISLKDVKRVGRLMAEFITELDADTLEAIAWKHASDSDNDDEDDTPEADDQEAEEKD